MKMQKNQGLQRKRTENENITEMLQKVHKISIKLSFWLQLLQAGDIISLMTIEEMRSPNGRAV